jgi:hypothetical protein
MFRTSRMTAVAALALTVTVPLTGCGTTTTTAGYPASVPTLTDGMPAAGCTRLTEWGAELVLGGSSNTEYSPQGIWYAVPFNDLYLIGGEVNGIAGQDGKLALFAVLDLTPSDFVHAATFNELAATAAQLPQVDPAFGNGPAGIAEDSADTVWAPALAAIRTCGANDTQTVPARGR